jgi:hypothetical protein
VLRKHLVQNGEDIPRAAVLNRDADGLNACDEELSPNMDVDDLNACDEELSPNRGVDERKVEGAAADVDKPKADELKAGADVPSPEENVVVFGANG